MERKKDGNNSETVFLNVKKIYKPARNTKRENLT